MDVYGVSGPDPFRIDDLLDFSNADIFSSSSSASAAAAAESSDHHHHQLPHSAAAADNNYCFNSLHSHHHSADFTPELCVPTEDAAELEWLSTFVEDSFSDIPENSTMNLRTNPMKTSFQARSRTKRSKSSGTNWTAASVHPSPHAATVSHAAASDAAARRCTHCASEKTPQWRTGPLGPKTLCNACGVRYKSGRLVPEYRPAASPTFVLTQHSNSHRKVLELRRQKEMLRQQQHQQQEQGMYGRHFPVC